MPSSLNIAALSRRTGVPADTLRKWEQRYGVLQPERTGGGQRRYSELDVARVEWLRERLAEGFRISEAAGLLGGAQLEPARTPADVRRALYDAASRADVDALRALLDQTFTLFSLEQALSRIVEPVLQRVGEGWASGELSVAQEHLVSAAIRARLERLLADARGDVRGVAVLACVPGELHELGLLMLGTLLRADGWQVAYLGANAPLDDAFALAERLDAPLVCLSVTMREHVNTLTKAPAPPGVTLVLGGHAASDRVARRLGARHVNDTLRRSVRELRKLAR
jgi:MerR family transcriptional regulator, light-induced transcriptional regulator